LFEMDVFVLYYKGVDDNIYYFAKPWQ